VIDHLSQAELRLLSIALNRPAELGNWDEDALKLELEELIDLGEDVIVSCFEEAERFEKAALQICRWQGSHPRAGSPA